MNRNLGLSPRPFNAIHQILWHVLSLRRNISEHLMNQIVLKAEEISQEVDFY